MATEPRTGMAHTSETHANPNAAREREQQAQAQREQGQRQLERGKADKERILKDYQDRMKGRPTPTQEECDQIKLGMNPEISPDGSNPDPHDALSQRQMGAERPSGGYRTRESTAQ
jgi:hypothetical protein